MSEPKTRPTGRSVGDFLDTVEPESKRGDCWALVEIMRKVTGVEPVMWGPSIIGFGAYTYLNTTNKPAAWPITGFSPRKASLTLYITPGFSRYDALLEKLGKHTTGKSCLYIKKLSDVNLDVLEELVTQSVSHMRAAYPTK